MSPITFFKATVVHLLALPLILDAYIMHNENCYHVYSVQVLGRPGACPPEIFRNLGAPRSNLVQVKYQLQ